MLGVYLILQLSMNILIADDHQPVRTRLIQMLSENFNPVIIEEAWDFTSLIEKAMKGGWELIVSDLAMPGGNSQEVIRMLCDNNPGQRILIISMNDEKLYAGPVREAGAAGYVNKNKVTEDFIPAVTRILGGNQYFPSLEMMS